MLWFAEGRRRDLPEPHPLPPQFAEEFGKGLQTPSGKLEFVPESLGRNTAGNPERPPLNRYFPSWEGLRNTELAERARPPPAAARRMPAPGRSRRR